jgi:hypothetical protein
MAIILYRKGNIHKVNGIPCEYQICNEYSYLHLLKQGWHYTPEECYAEEKQEIDDKATSGETPEETEPELVELPELSEDDLKEEAIRKAAKDAGIEHWWNKSIERLTSELKGQDDAERS